MQVIVPPLVAEYQQDMGLIEVNTEFTEGLALGIEKMLVYLFDYYKYQTVTLRINSPGGSLTALKYIVALIHQARLRGRRVNTEATFTAASAGALLLSHGHVGTRSVQPLTQLLYHHTRFAGATPALTSSAADMLSLALRRNDSKLIAVLILHLAEGFGGVDALCQEGIARCELLLSKQSSIARELDLESTKPPRWLAATAKQFRDCAQRQSTAPLQKYLEARFNPDTPMELQEAYALLLIDEVRLAPSMLANARLGSTQNQKAQTHVKLAA